MTSSNPSTGMRARHRDREAHQGLRRAPRDHRGRPHGPRGRGVRLPRAERRRQDDHDPHAARPPPTDERAGTVFGIETTVDPVAIHRRVGYLPGEFVLYDKLTGGQTIEYFANLRGGVDRRTRPTSSRASTSTRRGSSRSTRRATSRRSGLVIALQHRPELLHPRRADVRPRSARPADVLRRHPRGEGRGPHDLPVEPHPVARSSRRVTAWRSSATAGWRGSTGSTRCVTSRTTRSSCSLPDASPRTSSRRCPA